jgi:hypothetical protein
MISGDIYHFEDEPHTDEALRAKLRTLSAEELAYSLVAMRQFFRDNMEQYGPREMIRADLYTGAAF